ncbi:MAG TPA: M2 family metallopeptidase, partial [Candidatus Krumholzibacteria bacterium]|nr:M2 family metallopeptidase [Candidatus Krumholzibacteria bacterium]
MTTAVRSFLDAHVARIEPLSRDVNLAYWSATISGKPEDFERYARLEVELQKVYTSAREFEEVKGWLAASGVDGLERRQLDLLYRVYLRNQIDPAHIEEMTRLSSKIVQSFGTYRAHVDGRSLTGNDVRNALKQSTDAAYRRRVWEADKAVGREVRDDLLRLVRLRNEVARSLGFADYYVMSLELSEQQADDMSALFDRLDLATREPFARAKAEIDAALALRYAVRPGDLRPWHYEDPFFQEAPRVFD